MFYRFVVAVWFHPGRGGDRFRAWSQLHREKGSPAGLFEKTGSFNGAGKGPPGGTEKVAFKQVFGYGGAVDGDILIFPAKAVGMDGLVEKLFAGACFAVQHDRRRGVTGHLGGFYGTQEFGIFADGVSKNISCTGRGFVRGRRREFGKSGLFKNGVIPNADCADQPPVQCIGGRR